MLISTSTILGFINTGGKSLNVNFYSYKFRLVKIEALNKKYKEDGGPDSIDKWVHGSAKYS